MKSKNREKAAQAIEAFLRAIGESSETNVELRGTGARVADMFMDELCAGNQVDPRAVLEKHKLATGDAKGWVIVRDRAISTTCPHHLMPAIGTISMGYLPKKSIVGLGALGEVADAFSRRLALQEAIGENICSAIKTTLECQAVFALIDLSHACMTVRGERRHEARVVTISTKGSIAAQEVALLLGSVETGKVSVSSLRREKRTLMP